MAKKQSKKHKKWKPVWIQMQKEIEELKKGASLKVDQSVFEEEIERIEDLINQLANSGKDIKVPVMSSSGVNLKDFADLREQVKRLQEEKADKSKTKSKLKSHKKDIKSLEEMIKGNGGLIMRVDKIEEILEKLKRQLEEYRSIKTMQSTAANDTRNSLDDDNMFRDANGRINHMQSDLDNLKNEFARWIKEFQDALNHKADIDAL